MGASEFAKSIADDLFSDGATKKSAKHIILGMADRFDVQLQEVREVLVGLQQRVLLEDNNDAGPCWCDYDQGHEYACQRARALYRRLIPEE